MNGCYYLALDRIDQGVAVTFEMVGPLGVAAAGPRRGIDLVWVAPAGAGIALLTGGVGSTSTRSAPPSPWPPVVSGPAYILLSARVG